MHDRRFGSNKSNLFLWSTPCTYCFFKVSESFSRLTAVLEQPAAVPAEPAMETPQ